MTQAKFLENMKNSIEYTGSIPSTMKIINVETVLVLFLLGIVDIGFVIAFINILIRFKRK